MFLPTRLNLFLRTEEWLNIGNHVSTIPYISEKKYLNNHKVTLILRIKIFRLWRIMPLECMSVCTKWSGRIHRGMVVLCRWWQGDRCFSIPHRTVTRSPKFVQAQRYYWKHQETAVWWWTPQHGQAEQSGRGLQDLKVTGCFHSHLKNPKTIDEVLQLFVRVQHHQWVSSWSAGSHTHLQGATAPWHRSLQGLKAVSRAHQHLSFFSYLPSLQSIIELGLNWLWFAITLLSYQYVLVIHTYLVINIR